MMILDSGLLFRATLYVTDLFSLPDVFHTETRSTDELEMCRCDRYSDRNRYRSVAGRCARHCRAFRSRCLYLPV